MPAHALENFQIKVGTFCLRVLRKPLILLLMIGAKRRAAHAAHLERQNQLQRFWKAEQTRLRPNMRYLLNGALFVKPEYLELETVMNRYPFLRKEPTEQRALLAGFRKGWIAENITYS